MLRLSGNKSEINHYCPNLLLWKLFATIEMQLFQFHKQRKEERYVRLITYALSDASLG